MQKKLSICPLIRYVSLVIAPYLGHVTRKEKGPILSVQSQESKEHPTGRTLEEHPTGYLF